MFSGCYVATLPTHSPPAWPFLFDLKLALQRIQCRALFWFGAVPYPSFDIWAILFLTERCSQWQVGRVSLCPLVLCTAKSGTMCNQRNWFHHRRYLLHHQVPIVSCNKNSFPAETLEEAVVLSFTTEDFNFQMTKGLTVNMQAWNAKRFAWQPWGK